MRALVAPKYCRPDGYEIAQLPLPELTEPNQVLIRIHAAAMQAGDCQFASGSARMFLSTRFPMILAHEGAGVVAAVGAEVRSFRVGDAVYGIALKRPMGRFWTEQSGWCADYAVASEDLLLPKPAHLSFEEAASLLGSTLTAIQITRAAIALNPAAFPRQSLEGKTALVTAGLGAATSIACQLLKNVYGAGR
ncbi:hypothetical protein FJTKL_04773 [Diaporthe vaccinii]|uniref:Alcohol dehydrogenase-like N-terminal domain-containing protein n=1 Tax=Diaporthe vaccinii TaxID=105482 RepID=A0ABR4F024_9PEZI